MCGAVHGKQFSQTKAEGFLPSRVARMHYCRVQIFVRDALFYLRWIIFHFAGVIWVRRNFSSPTRFMCKNIFIVARRQLMWFWYEYVFVEDKLFWYFISEYFFIHSSIHLYYDFLYYKIISGTIPRIFHRGGNFPDFIC